MFVIQSIIILNIYEILALTSIPTLMFHTVVLGCAALLEGLRPILLNRFRGVSMDQKSFPSLVSGERVLYRKLVRIRAREQKLVC